MKKISILGSTGSIGTQALDVIRENKDKFELIAISGNTSVDMLFNQIKEFSPKYVAVYDEYSYIKLKGMLDDKFSTKVLCGMNGLKEICSLDEVDVVLTAVVGMIGLLPTLEAIKHKKNIALANKETLVCAGELVISEAKKYGVKILPVDSEHSAIFQCLNGEENRFVDKIILTASGGPFRGKTREELINVTKNEALKHPNWSMGQKISIDSSTLMNKGLEVIEARWLFDTDNIDVLVHPQSIIHSMVEFNDSSVIAQLGCPDMKLPIQYALTYPDRVKNDFERLDLTKLSSLTFEKPDKETFPCLNLAYESLKLGDTYSLVLNSCNEVLVDLFLKDQIGFYDIPKYIEYFMKNHSRVKNASLEEILNIDFETRTKLNEMIGVK